MSKREQIAIYALSYAIIVTAVVFGGRELMLLWINPASWIVGHFVLGPIVVRLLFGRKAGT